MKNEIALLQDKLNKTISKNEILCSPELIDLSKELDELIVKYYVESKNGMNKAAKRFCNLENLS